MTEDDAADCLGIIVSHFNGFEDDVLRDYVEEFRMLDDPHALAEALAIIKRTATTTFRPAIGTINDEYRAVLRRRSAERPALPAARDEIPWREGIAVAQRAYEVECARQNRIPKPEKVAKVLVLATAVGLRGLQPFGGPG
jgi:hypothetical protein